MKSYFKILIIGIFGLIISLGTAFAGDVYVKGYTRSDGTYVRGHYRSSPNNTVSDNFSTYGNINPYTGKVGTKKVYDKKHINGYHYHNRKTKENKRQNEYLDYDENRILYLLKSGWTWEQLVEMGYQSEHIHYAVKNW